MSRPHLLESVSPLSTRSLASQRRNDVVVLSNQNVSSIPIVFIFCHCRDGVTGGLEQ